MMKLVNGNEFEASKRTIASTKLADNDLLLNICATDATTDGNEQIISSQIVVLQSADGYFIKFPLSEIPEKKKGAIGVRGIKLSASDHLEDVYLIPGDADITIDYRGKELSLKKLKLSKRDGKGTKVRT